MRNPANEAERIKREEIEFSWLVYTTPVETQLAALRREWLKKHLDVQNFRCAYCNVYMSTESGSKHKDRRATIDHVIAMGNGGADLFENTAAACSACNRHKSDSDMITFKSSAYFKDRYISINTPPSRLAAEPDSPFYESNALDRGVMIIFKGRPRTDIVEYDADNGWVRIPVNKSRDRNGSPMTVKVSGYFEAYYDDTPANEISTVTLIGGGRKGLH
ncbi:MAG: DUF3297 family protein [Opitutae bacterium]|jgi:hypothetical protein|nr:DUF3297 family protein [Opitutae bacterium]